MKNSYSDRFTSWSSSGSPKGDFLLQYAKKAHRLLMDGRSVTFKSSEPIASSDNSKLSTLGFFSGGSSGKAELVKHNELTIASAVSGLLEKLGPSPIHSLCCLPLWHVGGWMQIERAWASGGQVHFSDYQELKKENNQEVLSGKWISLVPTQLHELLKSSNAVNCLKRANGIFMGGAGMPSKLVDKARSLALPIFPCYGSSETAGMVTLLSSDAFLSLTDGVGESLSHASVRINRHNHKVEILSSSICLSRGNNEFPADAWLKTPDLGYIEANGSLVITGRSDRVINSGGEKVQPEFIENILNTIGIVEQCLVHGEPHEKWGECVVATICPASVNLVDVQKIVANKLPSHMQPKVWRLMDQLPLTDMGKPKT